MKVYEQKTDETKMVKCRALSLTEVWAFHASVV